MILLAIYGSARENGNTDILLDKAVEGSLENKGTEVKKIYARKLKITPCRECHACSRTGKCVINDDMTEVYGSIREADRVILAAPIFLRHTRPSKGPRGQVPVHLGGQVQGTVKETGKYG